MAFAHEGDCDTGDAAWNAAVTYDSVNDECDLNSAVTANGTITLGHTLHIGPAGKITTTTGPGPATGGLTLNIDPAGTTAGDFVVDTPSGATGSNGISGDILNAFGRPITINATGDVTLHGNGTKGARAYKLADGPRRRGRRRRQHHDQGRRARPQPNRRLRDPAHRHHHHGGRL